VGYKNKNIRDCRGINEFKRGYKPESNLVKDKNGNLLADLGTVLNMWKKYYYQVLIINGFSDIRQI
jgi:hypothetical protein